AGGGEADRAEQRGAGRQLAAREHAAAAGPPGRRGVRTIGLDVEVVVRVVRHQLERGDAGLTEEVAARGDRVAGGGRGERAERVEHEAAAEELRPTEPDERDDR